MGHPASRVHTMLELELRRNIYLPDQWNNFFFMVGSGAAALAGLIFVAMSINHEIILRETTHKNRAINMLTASLQFSWHAVLRLLEINILECSALSGLFSGSSQQASSSGAMLELSNRA